MDVQQLILTILGTGLVIFCYFNWVKAKDKEFLFLGVSALIGLLFAGAKYLPVSSEFNQARAGIGVIVLSILFLLVLRMGYKLWFKKRK